MLPPTPPRKRPEEGPRDTHHRGSSLQAGEFLYKEKGQVRRRLPGARLHRRAPTLRQGQPRSSLHPSRWQPASAHTLPALGARSLLGITCPVAWRPQTFWIGALDSRPPGGPRVPWPASS